MKARIAAIVVLSFVAAGYLSLSSWTRSQPRMLVLIAPLDDLSGEKPTVDGSWSPRNQNQEGYPLAVGLGVLLSGFLAVLALRARSSTKRHIAAVLLVAALALAVVASVVLQPRVYADQGYLHIVDWSVNRILAVLGASIATVGSVALLLTRNSRSA
ncbi:hypothetical protein JXD38_12650 [candidate division WOR-3 bacterium]|nr:hypothetical protein [candidate division WOR-3 bacterium]